MLKEKFYYDNMVDEGEYKKEFTLWYEKGKNVIHNFDKFLSLGNSAPVLFVYCFAVNSKSFPF